LEYIHQLIVRDVLDSFVVIRHCVVVNFNESVKERDSALQNSIYETNREVDFGEERMEQRKQLPS
jgi:hypothetical protein